MREIFNEGSVGPMPKRTAAFRSARLQEAVAGNTIDTIIENDAILACQWAELHYHKELAPEARLCLGVLRQALMDIACPTGPVASVRDALKQDALDWLAGAEAYITLEHVCGMLRIKDARGFAQRLLRAIAAHDAKEPFAAAAG